MVLADSLIQKKSDSLNVRNTQQQIRLNILNAVVALQSAKDSLVLAQTQDKFSSLNLDAEHTKYSLGTEIQQNVVTAQQQLAQADFGVLRSQDHAAKGRPQPVHPDSRGPWTSAALS